MILRLKHAQQEIKKKQADLKKTEQGYQKDKSAYDDVQKNLKALEVGTFVRKTIRPPTKPIKDLEVYLLQITEKEKFFSTWIYLSVEGGGHHEIVMIWLTGCDIEWL